MHSAKFNGSCKNDNFQLKNFVLCSYFCSEIDCGLTLGRERKMCTPVKPSCTI